MALLIDLFGYLSIILHGLVIVAQSMALGGVFFLILLARPFAAELGSIGREIKHKTLRMILWSAVGLIAAEATTVLMQVAVLMATVDSGFIEAMGANFALAGVAKVIGCLILIRLVRSPADRASPWILLGLAGLMLAAGTATTHAAARLEDSLPLLAISYLHQLGAALWIGGIPVFIAALNLCSDGIATRRVGKRFSQISMAGVMCILVSATGLSLFYIHDFPGFYGTAYGVMAGAKLGMFLGLLGLGGMNFLLIERLFKDPTVSVNRLKRFAEVEVGVGFTLFFAAASLTSVPPAIDLTLDRVSWSEIVERNTPAWPTLSSPDHADLAIPALQEQLDREAAARAAKPVAAFIPGAGDLPPRNINDIRWSEYNHHWSGLFVIAIGILALLQAAGLRAARHWPLLFLGLAAFLFLRSDPEVWPMGEIGFFESLRDVEVIQHRFFVFLTVLFGIFEWRVRTVPALAKSRYALVFPLVTALGGAGLLTHSHAIANVKDQLLIELTHTPLALAGIAGGWARWLEIRLEPPGSKIAGLVWPVCFIIVGLSLLLYREI